MMINEKPQVNSDHTERILELAEDLRYDFGENIHEKWVEETYRNAACIADQVIHRKTEGEGDDFDLKLDKIVTNPITGIPIMVLLLIIVFWITIQGANYPSSWLFDLLLGKIHPALKELSNNMGLPLWLDGFLLDGVYLATAWVVSVMLPPMAIFFPLFTLLEDFGYLPRVAFNLDTLFKKTGAHGKQALSMVMGFGCNAAGVVATRIIDSPRERLIAIITNNFSLCNGRWPTQILMASIFLAPLVPHYLQGIFSALAVVGVALLGVLLTFGLNWILSRTVLRGTPSIFSLELPPYRPPRIFQTIYTSMIDRTLIILGRAVIFAAPAGAVIWLISNIQIGANSIAAHLIEFLDPFGEILGLNGVVLLAFLVAIPANEIVIPTVLMLTVLTAGVTGYGSGAGVMFELESMAETKALLTSAGWTVLTGINVMIFSLVHNPCSTTIYTIYKETGSKKWTLIATLLPLLMGIFLTFIIAQVVRLLGGIT
jgi:ferrous iron transport protein B